MPQLTRIPTVAHQDIDVLFYGAINERRKNILEGLIARGLRIEFLSGVYREECDRLIARAKVVLNMHYYDASVFEIVRVSYLLSNEKAVAAECGETTTLEADIRDAVRAVPYDRLIDACVELAADTNKRANLARNGFEIFARRDEKIILGNALGVPAAPPGPTFPTLLNLGSGKDWRENCLNVDISAKPSAPTRCSTSGNHWLRINRWKPCVLAQFPWAKTSSTPFSPTTCWSIFPTCSPQ